MPTSSTPRGGRTTTSRRRRADLRKRRAKRHVAAATSWSGNVAAFVAGCVLMAAALASVLLSVVPGLAASMREGGLSFAVRPEHVHIRNWLLTIGLLAALIGFNMVYFAASDAIRKRALAVFLTLYAAEFVFVVWAAVWIAGTGRPVNSLFDSRFHGSTGVPGLLALIGVIIASLGIMLWLGNNSTFDQQREEYFGTGSTRVEVTRMGLRAHLAWLIGLMLLWVSVLAPVYLADARAEAFALSAGDAVRPWPHPVTFNDAFVQACMVAAMFFALLWGMSASFLVQKLLYGGPLAGYSDLLAADARPPFVARALARLRHWPIPIGAVILSTALAVTPSEAPLNRGVDYLVGTGIFAACFALGTALISQAWRGRRMSRQTLRLHQGHAVVT